MIPEQLQQVAQDVHEGRTRWAKIRTLVGWFGAYRRRPRVVTTIREALEEAGLRTTPDFEHEFLDNYVTFVLDGMSVPEAITREPEGIDDEPIETEDPLNREVDADESEEELADESPSEPVRLRIIDQPSYQVSHLLSARKDVIYVSPDTTLTEATTKMHYHDFDQLPVMTGPRSVRGMISWKSIGRANARAQTCTRVADCMEPAKEISLQESIFDAFRMVQRHESVLIKDHTNTICGIVTLHDIAGTFNELAEPFLLTGEIENLIRNLIAASFSLDDIRTVWREGDKTIDDVSDMTFGQYVRLLENTEHWSRMPLDLDRVFFTQKLHEVREVRNDVMHFEPEGVEPEKLRVLREFAKFLHNFA